MKSQRPVATVLFTDIVGSTERLTALGDASWRELLDRHDAVVRQQLRRCGGREISTAGDGFLAVFDGPAAAIRCACGIRDRVTELGLQIRCGLHMGELELNGDTVGGIAVHIGSRVASRADAGEVLVSSTVHDAVQGSGVAFEDRGTHALKGVRGDWRLFAVSSVPPEGQARSRARWRLPRPATQTMLPLGALTAGLVVLFGVFVLRYNLDWQAVGAGAGIAGLVELGALWLLKRRGRRKRTLRTIGYGGGILFAGALAIGFAVPAPDPPRVLIVPFSRTGSAAVAERELAQGVAGLLREQLAASAFLRPVPTLLVQDLYRELGVGPAGPRSAEEAARLFEASGARYLAMVEPAREDSVVVELFDSIDDWRPLDRVAVGQLDPEGVFAAVARSAQRLKQGFSTSPLARFEREPALDDALSAGAGAYQDFLRGRQLYFFDDLPGAREALEQAVGVDSTFALAHAWLARVYDRLFDPRADAELDAARRFAAGTPERDRDFVAANALLIRKAYDDLAGLLPTLVAKHAEDAELLLQFGEMYRALEYVDPASLEFWDARLDLYRRLAQREPRDPTVRKELGFLWAERGQWDRAETELSRVVALNPYSADGYYNLGMLSRVLGRYDRALSYFGAADSLRPGFARDEIAFTLKELGRYGAARAELLRQIASPGADTPRIVWAHVWLADLALETGDTAAARAGIETAARLVGRGAAGDESIRQAVLHQRAQLAWLSRDQATMHRVLAQMEAVSLESPTLHLTRARRSFLEGDSAAAWSELDRAVGAASPNEKPTYLYERAEARRNAGDLAPARSSYEEILRLNPNFARAHFGLGMTSAAAGQALAAKRHLEQFLELWSEADSTLPEVRQARAALRRLGSGSA